MEKVTQLHEYYMTCGDCDCDTWMIKMTNDQGGIEGILCANPECNNFVDNPDLGLIIEFEPD